MGVTNKGGRGKRSPDSLRRVGVRLPIVPPEIARLLDAICAARGGTRSEHVTKALIQYATLEEVKAADLVE